MEDTITSNVKQKRIRIAQATGIVMVATLGSAVFGLLRETILAAKFGTTIEMDAYFFSFDLIIRLPVFLLAALQAGLIPLYTKSKKEGQNLNFVSTVINVYMIFLLLTAVIIISTAPFVVAVLGSGFADTSHQTVTQMIRLLSPAVLFAGLWGVLRTLLNAEGEFFVSTISQSLLSIGIISAIVLLFNQQGIYCLISGIMIGSAAQVLWTAYWLIRRNAFRYRLILDTKDPRFRRFLYLLGPGLVGGLIGYIGPMVDKLLASYLQVGTIASLSFAARPMAIISRIAVYSFVTALLPALSLEAINTSRESFNATVVRTLGIVIFVTTPLSVMLVALRVPIIQLLFERGNFSATATASTANIFAGLAIGLMPMAIAVTLSTIFVSLEDTKTPAFFGAGSNLISKILFSLILFMPLGAIGLALSTSLKYVVSSIILFVLLRHRLPNINGKYLVKTLVKTVLASLLAFSPVFLITTYSDGPLLFLIGTGILIGTMLFFMFSTALQVPELKIVYGYLLRLKKRRMFNNFGNQG